jgi:hypothetical protein
MLRQRIFQGTSSTSAPFPILKTISPCGPGKAIFSSAFIVNCPGAAGRLSIVGWTGSRKKNSFLHDRCGNVIENKGPLWKNGDKAGMLLIAKEISAESGNVIEKKGDNRYEKS